MKPAVTDTVKPPKSAMYAPGIRAEKMEAAPTKACELKYDAT